MNHEIQTRIRDRDFSTWVVHDLGYIRQIAGYMAKQYSDVVGLGNNFYQDSTNAYAKIFLFDQVIFFNHIGWIGADYPVIRPDRP